MLGHEVGDGGTDGAAADVVFADQGGDGPAFQVGGAYGDGGRRGDHGAAAALVALGPGGSQPVEGRLPLQVALELAGGRKGLHHELHRGQQLSGARVAGGEVHGGERAVVDAQGEPVAVEDVEDVEDVLCASHEAEHLGDVHGAARPRVGEQLAELRALQRVEAGGGAGLLLERHRVLDVSLGEDEVLPVGRLLVGRDPLVDQVRHLGPFGAEDRTPSVVKPRHQSPLDPIGFAPPWSPGKSGFIGRARRLSSFDRLTTGGRAGWIPSPDVAALRRTPAPACCRHDQPPTAGPAGQDLPGSGVDEIDPYDDTAQQLAAARNRTADLIPQPEPATSASPSGVRR